jgi:hypothetical protein
VEKITYGGASCSVLLTTYYAGDQIEKNEIGRARSTYRGQEGCIQVLVGSGEGKRPLEGPSSTWGDNIKTDLQ